MPELPSLSPFQTPSLQVDRDIQHPGLLLDRYAVYSNAGFDANSFKQETGQKEHIERVRKATRQCADNNWLTSWERLYEAIPVPYKERWTQKTVWRLASHLARASTL